jgi:glutamate synthase domain-containing protein 3
VDEEDINEVKTYIYRHRESAELPKEPERLLKNWEDLLKKSKSPIA